MAKETSKCLTDTCDTSTLLPCAKVRKIKKSFGRRNHQLYKFLKNCGFYITARNPLRVQAVLTPGCLGCLLRRGELGVSFGHTNKDTSQLDQGHHGDLVFNLIGSVKPFLQRQSHSEFLEGGPREHRERRSNPDSSL